MNESQFLTPHMRLIETKEIVEVIAYNKDFVDINSIEGLRSVRRSSVERITPEEEMAYLRSKGSN